MNDNQNRTDGKGTMTAELRLFVNTSPITADTPIELAILGSLHSSRLARKKITLDIMGLAPLERLGCLATKAITAMPADPEGGLSLERPIVQLVTTTRRYFDGRSG